MGFGSFLKKAATAPFKLAKGSVQSTKMAATGNFKGSLGAAKGSLKAGAGPALGGGGSKPMAAAPDLGGEASLAAPRKLSIGRSLRGGRR